MTKSDVTNQWANHQSNLTVVFTSFWTSPRQRAPWATVVTCLHEEKKINIFKNFPYDIYIFLNVAFFHVLIYMLQFFMENINIDII